MFFAAETSTAAAAEPKAYRVRVRVGVLLWFSDSLGVLVYISQETTLYANIDITSHIHSSVLGVLFFFIKSRLGHVYSSRWV